MREIGPLSILLSKLSYVRLDLGFGSGDNESGFALLSSSKAAVYSVTAAVGVCV